MRLPYGVATHRNDLYVTNGIVHCIFHFKTEVDFPLVERRGNYGLQIGEFDYPHNLAVSKNGDVYVADYNNHRVQIFNSSLLRPVTSLNSRFDTLMTSN